MELAGLLLLILGALLISILCYQVYSLLHERDRMTKNTYMQFPIPKLRAIIDRTTKSIGTLSTRHTYKSKVQKKVLTDNLTLMHDALHFKQKM